MNRKQRREHIAPFILHSKEFGSKGLREETLEDGSIKFYFEGYASTIAKDGSGDIVMPAGIKLDRYKKNPIIKIGHKRGEENNIGVTTDIEVRVDGLYIKGYAILSPEIDDHAKIIHGLRHGLIKGFSIGFGDVKTHYDKDKDAMVIDSLELYEISLVDIPDNPLTIAKAIELYGEKFLSTNTKYLMEYNVGDLIVFDHKYTGREREEENEKKYLGKIIEKKEEGTIMRFDETMNGSMENPVVMIHIHKVINGALVPTVMVWTFYANEITDVELYTDEMSTMVKSLETKQAEEIKEEITEEEVKEEETTEQPQEVEPTQEDNLETTEPDGNVEPQSENDVIVEKSLHTNTEVKALQDKMDAKMKEYDEAIETVSDFIVMMQKSMEEKHSDIANTINTMVKTMKAIVIDSPLQYVKTEEKKQKPVSMLQKQLQAIKDEQI